VVAVRMSTLVGAAIGETVIQQPLTSGRSHGRYATLLG